MFDRSKDPNNLEELMISEYYRRIDENEALQAKLEEERIAADANVEELTELLQAEEEKVAHLQSVIDKDEGVVDLHEPILLYQSDVASEYYFKGWLDSHADDTGEGEGLEGYTNALNSNDKVCIDWFKNHKRNYTNLVEIKQHIFKFTLKVPVFGILAYDPEYNKTQLIVPEKKYADSHWVDMPLEEFYKYTAAKVRAMANKALKEYRDELAKKATEQEES